MIEICDVTINLSVLYKVLNYVHMSFLCGNMQTCLLVSIDLI